MEAVIARASFFYYFLPSLFLVFGVAALVLAAIGLYAVMTFAVQARRVEMGVRRALGATRRGVVTLVFRRVVGQVAVGLVLGAAAGALLSQSLTRFLISANPIDPVTLAAVGAVLAGVCVVATIGPAIWASRVNPVEALRTQ
jgi:ABC-type antimicrobial peptide transport system permease subunit